MSLDMNSPRRMYSLYVIAGSLIMITVALVMSVHAAFSYVAARDRIVDEIHANTRHSLNVLSKNISGMVEAYAINEYAKLVLSEFERRGATAIVIEDYNMGEILGQPAYVSGKIYSSTNEIIDYDPQNPTHVSTLSECYFTARTWILGADKQPLGTITVCNSDQAINRETQKIVRDSLIDAVGISLALVALLFLAMSRFLLAPISAIAHSVRNTDDDGIPLEPAPESGTAELAALGNAVNHMVNSVRHSRALLRDSEFRWKFAVEGSGDGLWDWNLKTNEVFFSRQWKSMLGFAEDEVENCLDEWEQRIHPEDIAEVRADVKRHLAGETEVYINRHRVRSKDGTYLWILDRGIVVERDEDGSPLRMIGTHSDITEQVEHQRALEYSATHDSLTGLPNRFLFSELIQTAMHRCRRNDTLMALIYIDLDGFKEINDRYGHDAGDDLLIKVSQRMHGLLRQEDIVARLGGDEFVIAVSDLGESNEVIPLLDRLLHVLKEKIAYGGDEHSLQVSASIGVTFYPQAEQIGPEALLRQADHAMYEAKAAGRNRYQVFDLDASTSLYEHHRRVMELQHAISHDELELYYQPKVDMTSAQVIGFEALLRWHHPDEGMRYPDSFLPMLSNEGKLMLSLGRWVMETAFHQLAALRQDGYDVSMAVNVSSYELHSSGTLGLLKSLLERYPDVEPGQVELELLEVSALEDVDGARRVISDWQELGFRVALDDFGTGYSTLGYLKSLPVDTLKIDKSFVLDMLHDSASFSILEAAMGLARAFRCNLVAEGVESAEHGEMLVQLGCNIAQGYAIARPMPSDQIRKWIDAYRGHSRWQAAVPLHQREWNVLYATVEHRNWVRMLGRYIDDPGEYKPPELDHLRCRFGEWLEGEAQALYEGHPLLPRVELLHTSLHELATSIIDTRDELRRRALFAELHTQHEQLLEALNALYEPSRLAAVDVLIH